MRNHVRVHMHVKATHYLHILYCWADQYTRDIHIFSSGCANLLYCSKIHTLCLFSANAAKKCYDDWFAQVDGLWLWADKYNLNSFILYGFLQSAKFTASFNDISLTILGFFQCSGQTEQAEWCRRQEKHIVLMYNTYEEMKDKSRLSKSLKISLYRLVSDLQCNLFTSEMRNGKS